MFRRTGTRDMGPFVYHLGQLVESLDNRGMVSGAGDVQGLTKGFDSSAGSWAKALPISAFTDSILEPEFLVGHDLVTPIGADSVDCFGVLGRGIARDLGVEIYELLGTSLVEPKFAEDGVALSMSAASRVWPSGQ